MVPASYHALAAALAWSIPTAVLASQHLPAAALLAALGILFATHTHHPLRRTGLCALPMLLAAMPIRTAPPAPVATGPQWLDGTVRDVVRAPITDRCFVSVDDDLRVLLPSQAELVTGDRIRLLVRAGQPAIPGTLPLLVGMHETLQVTPGPWSFGRMCSRLRRALEHQLLRLVPGEHGAMLGTLVLGRATRPDPELAAAHRATGLSHLLAVSGAHAAMLAFLLGLSSRGRHMGAGRTRSLFVMCLLLVYGSIAGAEPPVLRAVVAYALAALAARTGRPFGVCAGLLVPAWITCLLEPAAMTGPSFLLSYAAVIGLAIALRGRRPEGPIEWLTDSLRASLWATLLTAPLTLGFFGQLAPWTILLTPICAPLVAIMLLLGLVTATIGTVSSPPAELLAWPLEALAATYAWLVHAADHLPGTPIPAWFRPPCWAIVTASLVAALTVLARPTRRTLAGAIVTICSLWFVPLQQDAAAGLTLFAVGHGQAALATTDAGQQVLIDCGSMQGGYRAARSVDDALARRTIDWLVVTHADQDHHNGLPFLLERTHVRHAVMPAQLDGSPLHELLVRHGAAVQILAPGERTQPTTGIDVQAPRLPHGASDNDLSLWVLAQLAATTVLLTGDAQEAGTAAVLASGLVQPVDALVLPHHGRKNANMPHLLARARPTICLASAASSDGETRLGALVKRFGSELWVTGMHGSLELDVRKRTVLPQLQHSERQPPR